MTTEQAIAALQSQGFSSAEIQIILSTMPDVGEGFIDFDGCNDPMDLGCRGWNGIDRRCDCGNRRVSWVVEGGYAYGEAH